MNMTDNKFPIGTVYDVNLIGIVIFTVSLLGTIANTIVAVFTKKLPTMNNPFGRLSASQSTGEAVLCPIFCFYFSLMVFFDVEWMMEQSKQAGWILVICYDICIWSHLFIALNRLVAICFIRQYNLIFSKRNTRIMIIITWTIAVCTSTTFHKIFDCDVFYAPQVWAFVFSRNPTCDFISMTVSFYKDIIIVSIIGILDTITIINVHQTNQAVSDTTEGQRARRRREVNFLKQVVLQATVFVIELFTYFIFAWKFENKWATWALSTLAWVSVHTIDGWIIILFNSEFRRLITSSFTNFGGLTPAAVESSAKVTNPQIDYTTTNNK